MPPEDRDCKTVAEPPDSGGGGRVWWEVSRWLLVAVAWFCAFVGAGQGMGTEEMGLAPIQACRKLAPVMVGMSKAEVLRALGPPLRTYEGKGLAGAGLGCQRNETVELLVYDGDDWEPSTVAIGLDTRGLVDEAWVELMGGMRLRGRPPWTGEPDAR